MLYYRLNKKTRTVYFYNFKEGSRQSITIILKEWSQLKTILKNMSCEDDYLNFLDSQPLIIVDSNYKILDDLGTKGKTKIY